MKEEIPNFEAVSEPEPEDESSVVRKPDEGTRKEMEGVDKFQPKKILSLIPSKKLERKAKEVVAEAGNDYVKKNGFEISDDEVPSNVMRFINDYITNRLAGDDVKLQTERGSASWQSKEYSRLNINIRERRTDNGFVDYIVPIKERSHWDTSPSYFGRREGYISMPQDIIFRTRFDEVQEIIMSKALGDDVLWKKS